MTSTAATNQFFRVYDLKGARLCSSTQHPAAHQQAAIEKLNKWYDASWTNEVGGVLVLPTGGGKTFTAMHFVCRRPLSDGYKVLWLAHTHHLLEQAFYSLERLVGLVAEPRAEIRARVVSGTTGHSKPNDISRSDNVIFGTVQTVWNALRSNHPRIDDFLSSAAGKLFVVVDEAHHSPAPSYRQMVAHLRERFPSLRLLGLTATPKYTDERKNGWLRKLYPQDILYEVSPKTLMLSGVLAKPIFEDHRTDARPDASPDFDEREFAKWTSTQRDLPNDVVESLARNRDRNDRIVSQYVQNREKYGKTIIFADRWHQCEYLAEALKARGVNAGVMYSHIDAEPGSAAARNTRTADDNKNTLQAFKSGEVDVLINVRMLTEGTDVPQVQSVFLTRQTTSSILLTQMIGRALRGPKFGGTSEAYIVSFIDEWKHRVNWAEYGSLKGEFADEGVAEYQKRPPLSLISIELIQRLARQMDSGSNVSTSPFLSLIPVGWYHVSFESVVRDPDEIERVDRVILVFDSERSPYEKFISSIQSAPLTAFESEGVSALEVEDQLRAWHAAYFGPLVAGVGGEEAQLQTLFEIARHIAQSGGTPPVFSPYDQRENHDLDAIARQIIADNLGRAQEDAALRNEYSRIDRSWRVIYHKYELFKCQYDGCVNRLLNAGSDEESRRAPRPAFYTTPEHLKDREPSEELKSQIVLRDGKRCLCCGATRRLEVDHVTAWYSSGNNSAGNLQTLCSSCNSAKGTAEINFRSDVSPLREPPATFPNLGLPSSAEGMSPPRKLEAFIRRTLNFYYRCSAVGDVRIGMRGDRLRNWQVSLKPGNDPRWVEPHLGSFAARIRAARAGFSGAALDAEVPKSISVKLVGAHVLEKPAALGSDGDELFSAVLTDGDEEVAYSILPAFWSRSENVVRAKSGGPSKQFFGCSGGFIHIPSCSETLRTVLLSVPLAAAITDQVDEESIAGLFAPRRVKDSGVMCELGAYDEEHFSVDDQALVEAPLTTTVIDFVGASHFERRGTQIVCLSESGSTVAVLKSKPMPNIQDGEVESAPDSAGRGAISVPQADTKGLSEMMAKFDSPYNEEYLEEHDANNEPDEYEHE